ncbi:MAG: RNA 2',3'-cyclic phosphodiesterase [Kangiella sp.]|nr:MAG: RNA 2',3'-cyclic phosphodiesterase [Kangiella sp.]
MSRKSKKNKNNSKNLQRLFFAIDLEPNIKTKLITLQDRISNPLLYNSVNSAVSPSNFHITLSFLGDVPEKKLEMITDYFEPPSIGAFKCKTSNLLLLEPVNILALKVDDSTNNLVILKRKIEKQIKQITPLNIGKKETIPHISLFRNVDAIQASLDHFEYEIEFSVNSFSLMVSRSTSNGVSYETLAEWPLIAEYTQRSIKEQLIGVDNL